MSKPELRTFSLRVPKELEDQLSALAAKQRRSKNNLVIIILERGLEELKKSNHEARENPTLQTTTQ